MKFTEKEKKYLISAIESRMNIMRKEITNKKELLSDKHYQKIKSLISKITFILLMQIVMEITLLTPSKIVQ